jgi:hypothetical protein
MTSAANLEAERVDKLEALAHEKRASEEARTRRASVAGEGPADKQAQVSAVILINEKHMNGCECKPALSMSTLTRNLKGMPRSH